MNRMCFYLQVTEDDDSRVLVVPLLLFVLGVHTVPRHLERSGGETKRQRAGATVVPFSTPRTYLKRCDICFIRDGFGQRETRGILERDETVCAAVSASASPFTDLISTGDFLHFPERGVELADVVVLPPGVVIPH